MKTQLLKICNHVLVLLTFAIYFSCSSDELKEPSKDNTPRPEKKSLFLNLTLATTDDWGTRAGFSGSGEAEYDSGFAWESRIVNGTVYIFQGKDESDARFVTKGDINYADISDPALNQNGHYLSREPISCLNIPLESFTFDTNYDEATSELKYFALVVVNANDDFISPGFESTDSSEESDDSVTQETSPGNEDVENGEEGPKGIKFSEWALKPQSSKMLIESEETYTLTTGANAKRYKMNFITMVNATGQPNPLSGSYSPKTLVTINKNDFSVTEASSGTIPSTSIFLSRNVAKITAAPSGLKYENKEVVIGDIKGQVNILNVGLDVINTSSYPVMNIEGLTWEKDFFHSGIGDFDSSGIGDFDRVYWGKDPNYHSGSPLSASSFTRNIGWGEMMGDVNQPFYCLENTFDQDCMLQGQTTRMLFKCKWALYDKNDNGNIQGDLKDCDFHRNFDYVGHVDSCPTILNNKWVFDIYIVNNQNKVWCPKHIKEEVSKVLNAEGQSNFTITWLLPNGGYYNLKQLIKVTNNDGSDSGQEISDDLYNKIAKSMGLENCVDKNISFYNQGICWYALRIPHFNELTPWDKTKDVKLKDGRLIADYNDSHLGRYGVVRNNYYNILVTEIHNLGTPKIPDIEDDDTDDMPEEFFLGVEIKVNAWAKHDATIIF